MPDGSLRSLDIATAVGTKRMVAPPWHTWGRAVDLAGVNLVPKN
jgi:hypothetical protein